MLVKLHREMKNVRQSSFLNYLSKVVILDKSELPQKMLKLGNLRGTCYKNLFQNDICLHI